MRVAPLVGAWIEINELLSLHDIVGVAPLVGAWIEMICLSSLYLICSVAPLVGAWIEIFLSSNYHCTHARRSPRGSVD